MLSARFFSASGEPGDAMELPHDPFDGFGHEAALHQVIKAYLANQRQGNASTKTRGEVRGARRRCGVRRGPGARVRAPSALRTGRAAAWSSARAPRDYHQDVPKKVKALARRSAFNTRALAEQVSVIERLRSTPRRRRLRSRPPREDRDRRGEGADPDRREPAEPVPLRAEPAERAVLPYREVSAYDIMNANQLLIEAGALQPAEEVAHA
jgi:large subunit ribosomal protein L4